MREERREQVEASKEQTDHQVAQQAAMSAASEKMAKRLQNPDFLAQLTDPQVDSEHHNWIQNEMGPRLSGQMILGNRPESHERELKFGMRAKQERMIAEANPGRLCKGPLLKIAQGVHRREDASVTEPMTPEEIRVLRDSHDVAANMGSLSIGAKGIESLTQATTVTKHEEQTDENRSLREMGAGFFK